MHFSTTKKWKDMDPNRKVNLYKEKKKIKEQKLPARGPDITLKQVRRQIRYYKHVQRTKGYHV